MNKRNNIDAISRSYGAKNYQEDQLSYMEYRLLAGRLGKTNSTKEQLDELEKFLKENRKNSKDKTANKEKVKLSEKEVLELRIKKMEDFLSNDAIMAKMNEKVIEIKNNELNKLKEQLNNL